MPEICDLFRRHLTQAPLQRLSPIISNSILDTYAIPGRRKRGDVVVDIDRFELPIARFLPRVAAGTIESALPLLESDHVDAARG